MNEYFDGLHLKSCLIYLVDIIVFSDTYKEHLQRLVFQRIREICMKLTPSKCSLFKTRITFLGHIVSENGIQKINDWPTPNNPNEVRQFWDLLDTTASCKGLCKNY